MIQVWHCCLIILLFLASLNTLESFQAYPFGGMKQTSNIRVSRRIQHSLFMRYKRTQLPTVQSIQTTTTTGSGANDVNQQVHRVPFSIRNQDHHEANEFLTQYCENINTTVIGYTGPTTTNMLLNWHGYPKKLLFLAKPDETIIVKLFDAFMYLWEKDLEIVVEQSTFQWLHLHEPFKSWFEEEKQNYPELFRKRLTIFKQNDESIDLVLTFGGDGSLLHCNYLFPNSSVPPVMCFDFGSLGFLTPFQYEEFRDDVDRVLNGSAVLTLRMRLECDVFDHSRNIRNSYTILNEVVVDRGYSPYLSVLDLTCNSHYLTTLQGDGIIFATPTGSTAYSLSAGGSIVYPSVPAILLTPVCAHSLSFRPILLPDSAVLVCEVPEECRSTGWVSFDGKHRQELHRGERLRVRMSPYPMPTINKSNFTEDWFDSLRAGLMFNLRPRQKGTA